MSDSEPDHWNPSLFSSSPLFDSLRPVLKVFEDFVEWPTLDDYRRAFRQAGVPVVPVPQADRAERFEDHYEPRIYLKGELQTRLENWHDFFNALVWMRFPKTKSVLNELHYFSALQRDEKTNRSPLENAITLFDECGAIVISERKDLLDMIRRHEWKKLFIDNRSRFDVDIRCIVFGHAMYEKALNPYIGMTTNTLLIESGELLHGDIDDIDTYVARHWKQRLIESTAELKPLPILGVPGWYADNENAGFYDNSDYFRPRRDQGSRSI